MRGSLRTTLALLPLTALSLGCGDAERPQPLLEPALQEARGGPATVEASRTFIAHLTGAEEVPEPVETLAQGQANFKLSKDGTELSYRLNVANIEDVRMAHIHLAPAGSNGGVVVWLYPHDGPPPQLIEGRFSGVLAADVITDDDLTGLQDVDTVEELVAEIRAGNAYVNVHTVAFGAGEIRGQIR